MITTSFSNTDGMGGHETTKETLNYLKTILIWLLMLTKQEIDIQVIQWLCSYMSPIKKKMPLSGDTMPILIRDKTFLESSKPKSIKNRVSSQKQWTSRKYSSSYNPRVLILTCMLRSLNNFNIKKFHRVFQKQEE